MIYVMVIGCVLLYELSSFIQLVMVIAVSMKVCTLSERSLSLSPFDDGFVTLRIVAMNQDLFSVGDGEALARMEMVVPAISIVQLLHSLTWDQHLLPVN